MRLPPQQAPSEATIAAGVRSIVAGLNARERTYRWSVASPPDRLKGSVSATAGDLDGGLIAPDDKHALGDGGSSATADEDRLHHPREGVA